jgi:hypothetical protein
LAAPDRSGVLGYHMQLSDDGKFALVEYVFASSAAFRAAMQQEAAARGVVVNPSAVHAASAPGLASVTAEQAALESAVPGLKIFERGKATDTDILTEFKKHSANFALGNGTVRPQ